MATWTVPALVLRVVDGDTVRLELDLGWHTYRIENCRIAGINAPELGTDAGRRRLRRGDDGRRARLAGLKCQVAPLLYVPDQVSPYLDHAHDGRRSSTSGLKLLPDPQE